MLKKRLKLSHLIPVTILSVSSLQALATDQKRIFLPDEIAPRQGTVLSAEQPDPREIIFPDTQPSGSFFFNLEDLALRANGEELDFFSDDYHSYPTTEGYREAKDEAPVRFTKLKYEHFPKGFERHYNVSWASIHDAEKMLSLGREWREKYPELFEAQKKSLFFIHEERAIELGDLLDAGFVKLGKIETEKQAELDKILSDLATVAQSIQAKETALDNADILDSLDLIDELAQLEAQQKELNNQKANLERQVNSAKFQIADLKATFPGGRDFFKKNREEIIARYHNLLEKSVHFQDTIAYRLGVASGDIAEVEKKTGDFEGIKISPDAPWSVATYFNNSGQIYIPGPEASFNDKEIRVRTDGVQGSARPYQGLVGGIVVEATLHTIHEMMHPVLFASDAAGRPGLVVHVTNLVARDLWSDRDIETYWRATY
ncbi:coiled-coil domain-containing protein [Algicola sagamiensis]|uniref:hypothetical protein n=1 Tax=Algicola sagamiensis TaxID=163869 RepID=UPI00037D44DF|nr:hypothetical protein [Algicola sagamiensis]